MIGRGNRSTRRQPAPVLICPPQFPYDLTWGSNPSPRSGKPATNSLKYVMAVLQQQTNELRELSP
jgi:hypothetical protein